MIPFKKSYFYISSTYRFHLQKKLISSDYTFLKTIQFLPKLLCRAASILLMIHTDRLKLVTFYA